MTALLTKLVGLFPRGFRRQFGADMVDVIRADFEIAARRGHGYVIAASIATMFDLVRAAVAERLRPTWPRHRMPPTRGGGRNELMGNLLRDLRHAVRTLRRSPGFTAVAVVTLGLAIGVNVAIFAVVDAVLLDPLPYAAADRLVYIGASAPGSDLPDEFNLSAEFYVHYKEEAPLLEDAATYTNFTNTMRTEERVERIWMSAASASLFSTLGATPALGRLPHPDDANAVVISDALWTSWFGSDPDVLGEAYDIAGAHREIIGVMGPDFWFPDDQVLLWIVAEVDPAGIQPGRFGQSMVARTVPGARRDALVSQLTTLALQLPDRFGGSPQYARFIEQHRPIVRSFEEQALGDISGPLWVLTGAVGAVLLIACANVANLFGVRAERRRRDVAVRRALGAGRGRLISEQMAEAVVVAGLAGAVAVALAAAGLPLFVSAAPGDVPRLSNAALGFSTLAFAFALAGLSALLFGLIPALRASAPDLARLGEGGRGSTGERHWLRDGLVVGQTALALVLLIGSGLLVRSFAQLRNVDPGYDTRDLVTFQIAPEGENLSDGPTYARFHLSFMDRIAAMPGVESVGIVENVPLNEGVSSQRVLTEETSAEVDGGALIGITFAAGDYYRTMGIEVLQGRSFTRADHVSQPGNVVVSEAAAELLWPGAEAVGKRLQLRGSEQWDTVVGVVGDVLQYGFRDTPQPLIYFPLVGQTPDRWVVSSPAYVVKTSRSGAIIAEIRALVREVSPGAPMYRIFTMEGLAADSMVELSFTAMTLAVASALALLLGAIGLYGVLSYVVQGRSREIGLRMALGAEARRVRRMVVAQGARVVGLGVTIGVLVALGTTQVLGTLLYEVGDADIGTFVGMSAAMLLIGLLASYLPARRASNVDPVESLRDS